MQEHFPFNPDRPLVSGQVSTVQPITYYEQLAEAGALYDFLQETMHERFVHDAAFRQKMLSIFLERSPVVLPEVEYELLRDLHDAMDMFLTTVAKCNTLSVHP
ncbi:MAG: hypothetical protein RML15_02600 [Bacteroidota bacterium]|nr:hypothetical protein [Candidatus Kapabacteria bacterium]MCS7302586.1 hypothetical protein [Candidatus Kapabacteria bacterium]MDW8074239.1 hypothetical protein [Bacteroidota bacterium]MDW8271285.1 hypothetical protein [Bacteroidota bacterium]